VGRAESIASLVARLPAAALPALASDDAVAWIEEAPRLLTGSNDDVRASLGVEGLWSDPVRGVTGGGVRVLVFDQGRVDEAHADFGGRVIVGDAVAVSDHSTHVAGTLAGDGTRSGGLYAGTAPAARIISYALGSFNAGIFLYSNPGDLEADFSAALQQHGASLANLSLGSNVRLNGYPCSIVGDYGVTDALLDAIVTGSLGPPLPLVLAGGNERPNPACGLDYATTSPPAGAKNALSVGAINSDDDTMTSFSAWGPTDDGRIKPDLVAPGCQVTGDGTVTSTFPGDTYGSICGTSMAAPAVAGVLALLLEDSRARGLPDPPPASLRALAYHTALDLGDPGPDFKFGYGKLSPRRALDALRAGAVRRDSVGHGQTRVFAVEVPDAGVPFLATLVWDDPPASAGAALTLVNDLDLRVFDPSGARHHPWTLDPDAPALPAARSAEDHRNNVEQVAVAPAGLAGLWRVEVAGSSVAAGTSQPFSLIVSSGAAGPVPDRFVLLDRRFYRCLDTAGIGLRDAGLAGAGATDVVVASSTQPAGVTVTLLEQALPGEFSGQVDLGAQIQVSDGDVLTVSHALAGSAAASVDCVAPAITQAIV
ncbi:MAG: S8 family serine peptidase, partial [Planctomycetota bacterium]